VSIRRVVRQTSDKGKNKGDDIQVFHSSLGKEPKGKKRGGKQAKGRIESGRSMRETQRGGGGAETKPAHSSG